MSAPTPKQTTTPAADNEVELQSHPIDLAHKSSLSSSAPSSIPAVPARVIGDASKPIFLVKPSGSPGPVIAGTSIALPAQSPGQATAIAQSNPVPVAVTVPIPITVARFPAAIRPGTTVTLAPRVVSTTLATTSGTYTGVPSHVPKGPAAVASISLPRSAVASAVIRPAPSANPAISQVTGFPVSNRTPRPASVSVRPAVADVGSAAPISGTWVTVTPASAVVQQPQQVATLYRTTTNPAAATKSTTNLILTAGQKATPVLTPAPNASSISVVGQQKASTPTAASNITLLSVTRGSPSPAVVTTRPAGSPSVTVGPRQGPEVIKTTPTLLQTAQRTSSMTITSTTAVQGGDKQVVKSGLAASSSANVTGAALVRPAAGAAGQVQIAARTVASASPLTSANPAITANSGVTPVVFTGGLKNVTTVGKVGQQGIAVQFPQMSVSAVAAKVTNPHHAPVVAGSRPANAGAVPIASVGGNSAITSSRTFLVTTQATSGVPVAKLVPQVAASSSNIATPIRVEMPAGPSSSEVHVIANSVAASSSSQTSYSITPARASDGPTNPIVHPAVTQSSTPSKLMGTSPRPSILRKRDYEGVPLKAQKNLTASLGVPSATANNPSSNTTPTLVPTTPAISPPSPRRIELTPGGPNGDSSRSSSVGSTTLSASSSPGIPPDMDESNPPTSITSTSASIALGKALSGIIKQEPPEGKEGNTSITAKVVTTVANVPMQPEVMMSPRKKPRKQQLLGQELQEVRSSDDEMPPTISIRETRHDVAVKAEPKEAAQPVVRRPRVSLLSSYRQTWKSRNQHFVRYSDVKLKDERRPTVTDLANQKHILQKVHGWKVYHLTAQIEEMAQSEQQVHERLSAVLAVMEKLGGKAGDRDMMRVNELIKGNLQRSKVIRDGLEDSKLQVQKIFDHKPRAEEIIQRYMYKRLGKKREK